MLVLGVAVSQVAVDLHYDEVPPVAAFNACIYTMIYPY